MATPVGQAQTTHAQAVQALTSQANPSSTVNLTTRTSVPWPSNPVGSYHGQTGARVVSADQYGQAYPGQSSNVQAHAGEMFSHQSHVPEAPISQSPYSQVHTGQAQVGNDTGYYPVQHNTQHYHTDQSQQTDIDLYHTANDNNDFFPEFVDFQDE